jgi:hypothetical protein
VRRRTRTDFWTWGPLVGIFISGMITGAMLVVEAMNLGAR